MIRRTLTGLTLCVLALHPALTEEPTPTTENTSTSVLSQELDAYLTKIETDGSSGVVLAALGGEVVYRKGFGFADCAGTVPMTPDHLLMIGSITKDLTQLLAFQLAEEGLFRLEDPIGEHLPDAPAGKSELTIRQLLHHVAGLPDLVDATGSPVPYTVEYDYLQVGRQELLDRFFKAELVHPPGTEEEYSNLGYNVLGALFEVVTGKTFRDLLHSHIFEPAGMETMDYVYGKTEDLQFAEGCRADGTRWGSPIPDGMWGDAGPSWNLQGAGGLLGRADDLATFFGALHDGETLGPATAKYLDDRLVFVDFFKERAMGPAGSNGIFNAVAYWAETSDMRVVILTNRAAHPAENVSSDIIRIVAAHR